MEENNFYLIDYFINTFFNEDTDPEVIDKVWYTLREICGDTHGYEAKNICYIGLYGSQNYGLDNETSDIDCECFIFPSHDDIIFGRPMRSTTITTKYGTCVIKDVRMMFNEIRKSSPNILECFATNYSIVNRDYQKLITDFCNNIDFYALLDEYKILRGLEGLYHRYSKDTVAKNNCKSYANMLRICKIIDVIINNEDWSYSSLLQPSKEELEYLRWVKNNKDFKAVFNQEYFDNLCFNIEYELKKYFDTHKASYNIGIYDSINKVQRELIQRYIKLNF